MRELVCYVAVSLDGFIAGPDGEFDAFLAEGDHRDVINERFGQTIPTDMALAQGVPQDQELFQTVLMGWNTMRSGCRTASPARIVTSRRSCSRRPTRSTSRVFA